MKLNLFLCCVAVLASTMISSAQGNNNPSFTRGFAGNVEAGVLFKDGFAGEYVNVSSGYNILPGLFAGVGIGIKNQKFHSLSDVNSFLVPTFIQLRYSFLNKSISPFSEQVHKSFHRFERRFDFGLFSFLEGYAGGIPRFGLRPFFQGRNRC